jgi:hypothetical protein
MERNKIRLYFLQSAAEETYGLLFSTFSTVGLMHFP